MAGRKHNDQSLKELIAEMLKTSGMDRRYAEMEVVRCFHEVVGPTISKRTKSVFVKDRKLVIRPVSGVVKEELNYAKSSLLEMINEKLGFHAIEEIEIW
jgi:predicted nucleic acid-binding Zn ribbon protein